MWKPDLVVVDYETSGLNYHERDFHVTSAAFSWLKDDATIDHVFFDSLPKIKAMLSRLSSLNSKIVTYNQAFEQGVTQCVFPDIKLNWYCDVMRLVQLFDSGGDLLKKGKDSVPGAGKMIGLGLKATTLRVIPEFGGYEKEIYDWIRENVPEARKGKEGAHLSKAPRDIIERYNCFSGNERFITRNGIKAFNSFNDGDTVEVLGKRGKWRQATVKCFGTEELINLTVKRGKLTRVIQTTRNHRWLAKRNTKLSRPGGEFTTETLVPGTRLRESHVKKDYSKFNKHAVQHGIVFGDGTYVKTDRTTKIELIGEKEELGVYFTCGIPTRSCRNNLLIHKLPGTWKQLPDLNTCGPDYLLGFIVGWFATDGYVSKLGEMTLTTVSHAAMEWLRSASALVGLRIKSVNTFEPNSNWANCKLAYKATFENNKQIRCEFFLRTKHLSRIRPSKQKSHWTVISVEPSGVVEPVWCVQESVEQIFTLEGGILTRNCADTDNTLRLYQHITKAFEREGFDWQYDQQVYQFAVGVLVNAKIQGIAVERDALAHYVETIDAEVAGIDKSFTERFQEPILRIRERLRVKKQATFKKKQVTELPEFNITSKRHLEMLFVEELNQVPKLMTPTGKPSFKSAHMGQWNGAELLVNRQKRLIVKSQAKAIIEKSSYDGRLRPDMFACGTNTGRFRSGGGLNMQALARRDAGLMSVLVADPGYIFVSLDATQGEPSVNTHYTMSKNYKYFCFDGIGKPPFWQNGTLMIDDLYLAYASTTSMGRNLIIDAWNRKWDEGRSFAEQWVVDAEPIKKHLKKTRQFHKAQALALAYNMSPEISKKTGKSKMQETCREAGFPLSIEECRALYKAYWNLFPEMKAFIEHCSQLCKAQKGVMTNEFGFRGSTAPHKAFNWLIQSTLSSVMHMFRFKLMQLFPDARHVVTIHDEEIFQVLEGDVAAFQAAKELAEKQVNDELQWNISMRFGWVTGKDLFTCK